MRRREIFAIGPAAAVAAGGVVVGRPIQEDPPAGLLDLITQLEAGQGWEPSCVVAAKAFAAWQIRKVLGLPLPDPGKARMHVHYMRQTFERYRQSHWYEADLAAGKGYQISDLERSLS